jgi:hypothetical protein
VPAATEGPKAPGTTGVDVLLGAVVEDADGLAGFAGFVGFSGGMAGAVFVVTFGVAAGATAVVDGAVGAVGAAPGTTGGVGFAGFLPYKALFGSQSLFFLDSVASDSVVCACALLLNGEGVLVTNTATAKAAARPSTTPIINPKMVPPRCLFIIVCINNRSYIGEILRKIEEIDLIFTFSLVR